MRGDDGEEIRRGEKGEEGDRMGGITSVLVYPTRGGRYKV
jgi:hypothetical protein